MMINKNGNQIKNKSINFHTSNIETGFENKFSNSKYFNEKQ